MNPNDDTPRFPPCPRKPSYLLHKASGQAYSMFQRKTYYHGVFGTPRSRQRYAALVKRWLAEKLRLLAERRLVWKRAGARRRQSEAQTGDSAGLSKSPRAER